MSGAVNEEHLSTHGAASIEVDPEAIGPVHFLELEVVADGNTRTVRRRPRTADERTAAHRKLTLGLQQRLITTKRDLAEAEAGEFTALADKLQGDQTVLQSRLQELEAKGPDKE